tara:strand:+ start:740 stop:3211 length:2472 start_codon:yes stop_codon:yes gene_type:complete
MHDQRLGTAEWSDPEEFSRQHAFKEGMFWLGRSAQNGEPLGYTDDRHVCLVSGTRSGKGTSVIIPNLCLWPGSVVVVDPKGENATVTAARRGSGNDQCQGMGQRVHVLDPFEVAQVDPQYRSRFNPLDALDASDPRSLDEAGKLAEAIVIQNPHTKDPFWDQSARLLVKGLILHVLTDPMFEGRRNLLTVRELISRGDHEGVQILREELGEENPVSAHALLWQGVRQNNVFGGKVAAVGEKMADSMINSPKMYESFLQIASRNTEFLDSPGMESVLGGSDFNLSDLKTDPNGVSLYLSLPQRYMGEHFRWLRMMTSLIVMEMEAVPGQPASGHRVLMCLDEFAGLKRMEIIESAVAQIAGYGIKLFFVLQSLEQLKSVYKDNWETFLSNAGLKVFFGIEDHFSREYVSKLVGETELLRELVSSSESTSEQVSHTSGSTSSTTWGSQDSSGVSSSDNWKSMPFFLRNTAGVIAMLTGKRQASKSTTSNTSTSSGGSDGSSDSQGTTTGSTSSEGRNQTLHKRPLITPDEVGRYFGRIDDKGDSVYPGLGLVLISGNTISPVQRVNYFEDELFVQKFRPHPDHPAGSLFPRESIKLMSDDSYSAYKGLDHRFALGARVDYNYDLEMPNHRPFQSGRIAVAKGEVVLCAGRDKDWGFELRSPCAGMMVFGTIRDNAISIHRRTEIDRDILRDNAYAVADFARREKQFMLDYTAENWNHNVVGPACMVPFSALLTLGGAFGFYKLVTNWGAARHEISNDPGFIVTLVLIAVAIGLVGFTLWALIGTIIFGAESIPPLLRGKGHPINTHSQIYYDKLTAIEKHAEDLL